MTYFHIQCVYHSQWSWDKWLVINNLSVLCVLLAKGYAAFMIEYILFYYNFPPKINDELK